MTARKRLTLHDQRRVAAEAHTDPRSVARYLRGELKRRSTIEDIEDALRKLGFEGAIRVAA